METGVSSASHLEEIIGLNLEQIPYGSGSSLVDDRSVPGKRYWFTLGKSRLNPGSSRDLNRLKGLFRSIAEGRAKSHVGYICNVPFVLFTIEDVDVINPSCLVSYYVQLLLLRTPW